MGMSSDFQSAIPVLYCAENPAAWDDNYQAPEWAPRPVDGAGAEHVPRPDYLPRLLARPLDAAARQDAISWILKVHEFYHFRPVTFCLSVNYLDRFLSTNSLPDVAGGWAMQLLSVACVSVAAKMEETHVPLVVDLQILDPRFVFEPRTVRRMELLLMSALRWRMRALTPFDYVDPISSAFPAAVISRAEHLILSTHRVIDFLAFRPSTIAAAAVLCAAGESTDSSAEADADSSECFHAFINKEEVRECRQLMDEYLIDTCPSAKSGYEPTPAPHSPVGVLDAAACASCPTHKSAAPLPEPYMPPPNKRRRLAERHYCTATIEKLGDDQT